MGMYPQAIALVKDACEQYRKKLMTEELLQYRLMIAASIIVALEEKDLRRYLENAESRSSMFCLLRRDQFMSEF